MTNNSIISISLSGVILVIIIVSVSWLVSANNSIGYPFAYASGLVMLLTPCSLPLMLVITSLTIKQKRYYDAILIALSFSIGMVLVNAALGFGLSAAGIMLSLSNISNILFAAGGAIGYLYAINELFELKIPLLGLRMPKVTRESYIMALIIGSLLALGDIGCPNPFRYALLSFIIASSDLINGTLLGILYGFGSITPLMLIALLASLKINIVSSMIKHKARFEQMINLSFLPIGSFLITFGIFGEEWYESTIIHDIWENMFNILEEHGDISGSWIGSMLFLLLIIIPILAYIIKNKIISKDIRHDV